MRSIRFIAAGTFLFTVSTPLFPFAYLSEFVANDYSEVRDPQTGPESEDDIILSPRWYTDSAIDFRLCVGGSGIDNTAIRYGVNGLCDTLNTDGEPNCSEATRNSELLDDMNAAINSWSSAAANTDISFDNIGAADNGCGPTLNAAYGGNSGASAGHNDVFFNNKFDTNVIIPPGIVAFTVLNFTLQNDRLEMEDADIVFNRANPFVTAEWVARNGDDGSYFSFQGVMTHEMGHMMGLAHSFVTDDNDSDGLTTGATMYPSVGSLAQTVAIATLRPDDILGLKNLYGNTSTFVGSTYGGRISGVVQRSNSRGQRGAHVTIFSTTLNRTYAAILSGMDGTAGDPAGTYSISGLPYNHNFIVFVEDAQRDDDPDSGSDFPNWNPDTVNTPLSWALDDESEGLTSFALEAFPDAEIVDVRVSRNVNTSPGISNADVFRLTSSTKTVANVNFYVSDRIAPPNDDFSMSLLPTTTRDTGDDPLRVANGVPLQFEVNMDGALTLLSDIEITATATNQSTLSVVNLAGGLPSLDGWRTTRALLTLAPPSGGLADGTYTLRVSLSSTISGESIELVDASRTLLVSGWTSGRSAIAFGSDDSGTSGGGGGGCSFDRTDSSAGTMVLLILLFATLVVVRRKQHRNSLDYQNS